MLFRSAVEADNTAGLRTPRRAGWRGIGYAGFVRCLGRVLVFRSYGALRYGFALFVPGENGQVARAPRLAAEETTGGFVAKTTR